MGVNVRERGIYCHSVPGRMRLRLPRLKGAPERAERIARAVAQLPGVSEAAANPTTGSLLVLFDPRQTDAADLIAFLKALGVIAPESALSSSLDARANPSSPHPLAALAWTAGSALGREILRGALGHALRDTRWSILLSVV